VRLEDRLVLNRFFHHQLGVQSFEDLKSALRPLPEGPLDDGHSAFSKVLLVQRDLRIEQEVLRLYDRRVMKYERELVQARSAGFTAFRYFQYLGLLYTEMYLDRLTNDPAGFLEELNSYLATLRKVESEFSGAPDFVDDDMRRLAFFMATGSGKTLFLHVHIRQVLHYLEHGLHAEALVRRPDGRREFDSVLLLTPTEVLSQMHLAELEVSSLQADLLIRARRMPQLFAPTILVIDLHKLAKKPSRDGISIPLEELGTQNLVFVDEGHKGTATEERTWKGYQEYLARDGFRVEYSATFAQAVGTAGGKARTELVHEYGKAILFDYSYAHFYEDGYGKDFDVLNLKKAPASAAHELLVGGLLLFYQQLVLHGKNVAAYMPFKIEPPLWVLLGSSVNAVFGSGKRSDVSEVVAFLRRFLEDRAWAESVIKRILSGSSGYVDDRSDTDLFHRHLTTFEGVPADSVYDDVLSRVFHGAGALEVWELKEADGELGLRTSAPSQEVNDPYFGVVNIGDVSAFKTYLRTHVGIDVQEDRFTRSRFDDVNVPGSSVNLVIGAKRFIEGWNSWRVSSMGLMNIGKGKGSQVIQLFGRGVRLRGKGNSLKRSSAVLDDHERPDGISHLETLYIFGWNADYVKDFQAILANEDLGRVMEFPTARMDPWPDGALPVPQMRRGFDPLLETWVLSANGPDVRLDLTPEVKEIRAHGTVETHAGHAGATIDIDFSAPAFMGLLNLDTLYVNLLLHKEARGYGNIFVPWDQIAQILADRCAIRMRQEDSRDPAFVNEAALRVLTGYLDRFVRRARRQAESTNVEPGELDPERQVIGRYRVRVKAGKLQDEIIKLEGTTLAAADAGEPLPRLYVDRHLFNPVLIEGDAAWRKQVSISPPALKPSEKRFLADLRGFWMKHRDEAPYDQYVINVVRNLPSIGVGLFHQSGFFPDFVLWIHDTRTGTRHVRMIEPHGLHHGGLEGNRDKFEALELLSKISSEGAFQEQSIVLDGFILTRTELSEIPDAKGRKWSDLEKDYRLIYQDDAGTYAYRLLSLA
jgi:hypothetical protein